MHYPAFTSCHLVVVLVNCFFFSSLFFCVKNLFIPFFILLILLVLHVQGKSIHLDLLNIKKQIKMLVIILVTTNTSGVSLKLSSGFTLIHFKTCSQLKSHAYISSEVIYSNSNIFTRMVVAAIQCTAHQDSLGFFIFPKDSLTCRPEESNQQPSNNKTLALHLSHSCPRLGA